MNRREEEEGEEEESHQHLTVQKRPAAVGYQKDEDDEEGHLEGIMMLTML